MPSTPTSEKLSPAQIRAFESVPTYMENGSWLIQDASKATLGALSRKGLCDGVGGLTKAGIAMWRELVPLPAITSVWSTYDHVFMRTGEEDENENPYSVCMTCGAEYVLLRKVYDLTSGDYSTHNGEFPLYCTGRTDLVHGYERVCQNENGRACAAYDEVGDCNHTSHNCNCIQCD